MPELLTVDQRPAVVVGACGHSLAVMRALRVGGVPVVSVEANRDLPGARTRLATVHFVADINGHGLVDDLLRLRARIRAPGAPVLFLTNDAMVRTVGQHWSELEGHYALSWAPSRHALLPLLDKPALEQRCRDTGLNYPQTFVLNGADDVDAAVATIGFPMIVKPARPLSRFKTAQPDTPQALRELAQRLATELPFLVQQFIPGDDTHIHFSALYLADGAELARFDGRKLRSRPLGHTTVAESAPNDEVHALTRRFFDGLALGGPVSLELKHDGRGGWWVIEPTVGRTDFWLGVCVENGVNLPLVEYHHQCGTLLPATRQRDDVVWFNEDRDPQGRLWMARRGGAGGMRGRRSAYVFLHPGDPATMLRFVRQRGAVLAHSLARRLLGSPTTDGSANETPCRELRGFDELRRHPALTEMAAAAPSVFETPQWFDNLAATCTVPGTRPLLLAADEPGGASVLALRRLPWGRVESLSNYYAALYGPAANAGGRAEAHARAYARWLARKGTGMLRLHPVDAGAAFWRTFADALRSQGYWVDRYFAFGNWHHPCAGTSWAQYLAARPSRLRHTIVRTRRKLQADPGFVLRILGPDADDEQLQRAVADYEAVYARSWKKPEPHPQFVGALCRLAHAQGWLRLGVLSLDGEPAAAQIWLVKDGVASIYKLAYDQRHARRGVGTVLSAALTEHVLDVDHVREIDFLAGDDPYKAEWMDGRRERAGIVAFRRASVVGLGLAAMHFGARTFRRRAPEPSASGAAASGPPSAGAAGSAGH